MSPPKTMRVELTDRFLKSIPIPETGRVEVRDTKRPGLTLRIYASGRKVWHFEKRVKGGPKRKHKLGEYPQPVGLSQARALALDIASTANKGIDEAAEAKEAKLREEAARAQERTVRQVLDRYEELHLKPELRTARERRRQLDAALAPYLDISIRDLTREGLQARLDAKAAEGFPFAANRIRAAICAFTKWSAARSYLETDIALGLPKLTKERARDLILSLDEVRAIWAAVEEMAEPWRSFIKVVLLTGQRRGDIAGLTWDEVEPTRLAIGAERTKNRRAHIVHLAEPTKSIIDAIERQGTFVFSSTKGTRPISGFGKMKAQLDALLGNRVRPWRLHDIRTAFASYMADAGEAEGVVDRVLNHAASGSAPSTVSRVYVRADLLPQRAKVLDRWADVVTGERGNVVSFGAAQ